VSTRPTNIQFLTVYYYNFQKVIEFKFLGTLITISNNFTTESDNRITMANKCCDLNDQLRSYYVTEQAKRELYKTLLLPVLLYGNESWVETKAGENELKVFERKILRKYMVPLMAKKSGE
jgi:hypothetical protein